MDKLQVLYQKIEKIYWKEGIVFPEIRHILVWQTGIIVVSFILSITTCVYSFWGMWFTVGAILSTWSLYTLSKNILNMFRGMKKGSFLYFFMCTVFRSLLIGFLSYIAMVKLHASYLALFLGFTSLFLIIIIYTVSNVLRLNVIKQDK